MASNTEPGRTASTAEMTLLERLTQGRRGPLELLGLGALNARPRVDPKRTAS